LRAAERAVWDAYGVDDADRAFAIARFAGYPAPEGAPRYFDEPLSSGPSRKSTFRRVGSVLELEENRVRLWINGITPDEGVVIPFPAQMPGWLARGGATFDVTGVEAVSDLSKGRYRFQAMSWQDIDFDKTDPEPILPR
jgi:hypothetical protein